MKNVGILKYLSALLDERAIRGQPVLLQHVKGHSGNPGNDGADTQANVGTTFPPRPELDWEALEASVRQTIGGLVQVRDRQKATASGGGDTTELPPERPTKMSKHSHELTEQDMPTSISLKLDPKAETSVSTLLSRPHPALSPRHSVDEKPTGLALTDQTTSNFQLALASSTLSQHPHTNSLTANYEGLAASSLNNQDLNLKQETEPSGSLKSPPLKASRISPPLVPVSQNDIDPNVSSESSSNTGGIINI